MPAKKPATTKTRKQLPPGLTRALGDRKSSADSGALLNDLIEIWGGTRKLAMDVHQEFQKAAPGGMTRQRIIEMVQRLVINNTNQDIGRMARPSDMSDDELERVALAYLARVSGHVAPSAGREEAGPGPADGGGLGPAAPDA